MIGEWKLNGQRPKVGRKRARGVVEPEVAKHTLVVCLLTPANGSVTGGPRPKTSTSDAAAGAAVAPSAPANTVHVTIVCFYVLTALLGTC